MRCLTFTSLGGVAIGDLQGSESAVAICKPKVFLLIFLFHLDSAVGHQKIPEEFCIFLALNCCKSAERTDMSSPHRAILFFDGRKWSRFLRRQLPGSFQFPATTKVHNPKNARRPVESIAPACLTCTEVADL